jgi:ribose 5-phosphate isomerase A
MSGIEQAKQSVGLRVAEWVESGMTVGLGTGSTAAHAIRALGARVRRDHLDIRGVPTSFFAERLAREVGIPVESLDTVDHIDLAFDGADEVSPVLDLIKGRGAAQTREKVVATASSRFIVLVDDRKLVERLGTRMPVPVEVLPMALAPVQRALRALGGEPVLRMGEKKDGPVVTDQGFWVIDARFDGIDHPAVLGAAIKALPGVLDHGLFCGIASDVLVGGSDGSVRHQTRSPSAVTKRGPVPPAAFGP